MTTSKVIKIVAAVGVVALLSYGGLAWWQLNQFDRRVGEHRYISSPLYDGEIQVEKAFLKRNVQLTAGIDTDGQQPGQHSVADPAIVFDGVLIPGLHPTLKLTPIRIEDPQAEIFLKSNPRIELIFSIDMMPASFEMQWDKATVGEEVLGNGMVRADIKVDSGKNTVEKLSISGHMSQSETKFENERLIFGDKKISLLYEGSPLKLSLSFDTQGDQIGPIIGPNAAGPQSYKIEMYSTADTTDGQPENRMDFDIDIKDLYIQPEAQPAFNVQLKGSISTPPQVWLPCEFSRLMFGAVVTNLPGICPSPDMQGERTFSLNGLHGVIDKFNVNTEGADLAVNGAFEFKPNLKSSFKVEASAKDPSGKASLTVQEAFTNQIRSALQTLHRQGAVQKTESGRYTSDIEASLNENGFLVLTGNGVDLLSIDEVFVAADSASNSDFTVIIEVEKDAFTEESLTKEVVDPFRKASSKVDGIRLIAGEEDAGGRYLFHFILDEGADPALAYENIDKFVKQFTSKVPKGIEVTLIGRQPPAFANHDNPQVDVDADYCVVIESEKSAISEDELTTKVIEPFKQASENLVGVRLSSSQRDPDGRYLLGFNIEKDVDPSKAYEVIDQFLTKFASSKPDGVEIMLISYSH